MSFSSPDFLFVFLPLFFALYFACPGRAKNYFLAAASLAFYFCGAGYLIYIFLISVIANYVFAIGIDRHRSFKGWILVAGVAVNLSPLLYYKYYNFIVESYSDVLIGVGRGPVSLIHAVALPLGISFYTFHGISYLVDVYREKVKPTRSVVDFTMYMANFSQLIAGPIVRYVEIEGSVRVRPMRSRQILSGIVRFTLGLGKKLILADSIGFIADRVFATPGDQMTMGLAWLGAAAYTFQIYYDFSGYSDMAIGFGKMMGFEFPENFDQPYRSQSVTEFWRRWHMTLSRWFRDYVYIPLGGNRAGPVRTYFNLVVVFFLCGLWHGAAYGFVVWGLYHGLLLTIERVARTRFGIVPKGLVGQALTLVLVMIGWVFFRADTLPHALRYLACMFGLRSDTDVIFSPAFFLTDDKITFLLAACFFAFFPFERLRRLRVPEFAATGAQVATVLAVLGYSSALVAANGFNPFIYFRF